MLLRPNVTRPNVIRRKCTRQNVTEPIKRDTKSYVCGKDSIPLS